MQSEQPKPTDPETTPPDSSGIGTSVQSGESSRSSTATWVVALVAAVLAGVGSGLIGERTFQYFVLPRSVESLAAYALDTVKLNKEVAIKHSRNGALVYGTLGALLGLGLGVAGGIRRRSVATALSAGLVGLVLGAVAGALPAFAVMPWHYGQRDELADSSSLLVPILAHSGLWCALGAAAGLAFGLGRSGLKWTALLRGAIGGIIGAVIGAAVYDTVGFSVFPLSKTDEPFSASTITRILAHICAAVFIAAGAVVLTDLQARRPPKPTAAPAPES